MFKRKNEVEIIEVSSKNGDTTSVTVSPIEAENGLGFGFSFGSPIEPGDLDKAGRVLRISRSFRKGKRKIFQFILSKEAVDRLEQIFQCRHEKWDK